MRCIITEVNAAFMASYRFATRWQEGASAHDYDKGHYGANERLQFTVFAACSGPLLPFCPGGPIRVVGAFGWPNVSWGSFARFVAYTGKLNWFLPEALILKRRHGMLADEKCR